PMVVLIETRRPLQQRLNGSRRTIPSASTNSASATTAPNAAAPGSGGPAFLSSPPPRHTVAELTETQQPNSSDTLRLAQLVCDRTDTCVTRRTPMILQLSRDT